MASKRTYYFLAAMGIVVVGILAGFMVWEFTTSTLQAQYLTAYAAKMRYKVEPGASRAIYF
ncbi:MAG: hypothetical protein ABL868_07455, partial [Sulfuriferula sp.]